VFSVIVVGTDGSETASRAVQMAAELARQNHAKLHVVIGTPVPAEVALPSGVANVSRPSSGGGAPLSAAARSTLEQVIEDIDQLDPEIHTEPGNPADVIVKVADKVGADLIVVGSKGMRGTRRILGSVPNSVAHKAGCHVLVAKTA
jgi:nucleotide-binding universal stress UspA family protein